MNLENFKEKLKEYKKEDIIFTFHAEIQALIRQIDLEEVRNNLTNPKKLVFVEKEEIQNKKEKYSCYFAYSNFNCHKYVLTLNSKIIIVTIININRNWQKIIERKI
ncbi:hypothetical protein HYW76_04635 [Candidatus Pacearchaeota archaeon]|nr:hypothetical protein [Candidatus Pacearchaeota archaeon]